MKDDQALYLGIDIGGGSVRGVLINREGQLFAENKIATNREWTNSEFLDQLIHFIETFQNYSFESIGIGSPGPLNTNEGIIHHSANLVNLFQVPVVPTLQKKFTQKILLNNDANCAALGEYHFGKGKGSQSLLVLTLGTGLGAGWVQDGNLFNGFNGNGFELGHVTVSMNGALCGCGQKGCVESYFSARGFLNRYKEQTGVLLESAKVFFDKVELGEEIAEKIFSEGVEALAEAIRAAVHLVNPDKIVLVGGLTQSFYLMEKPLKTHLKNKIFPELYNHFHLEAGSNIAGSYGAATLCF
jgi:glucokinase